MSIGTTKTNVAGAGLSESGGALDILRTSVQEGATTKGVLGQQGVITEAGYQEAGQSRTNTANAAQVAEQADENAARGDNLAAGLSFASAGLKATAAL
jgi:hypothetical protein